MTQLRAFKPSEEAALADLASAPGAGWRILKKRPPGPDVHERLVRLGLASVMVTGPLRRARLTATGRYFAGLVAKAREGSSS